MISCSSSDKVDPNTQTAAQSKFVKTTDSLNTRNFPVSIGMTQQQIRELFPISEFKKKDAWSYGVDGGGYGIEVLLNESVLFFFWLHWETELVDGIVLVSPDYHIDENVHVGMSFSRFIEKYPKTKSFIGLLTSREGCYIEDKNYWITLDSKDGSWAAKYSFENGESEFIEYVDLDKRIDEIMIH